jgi:hypothetical protein
MCSRGRENIISYSPLRWSQHEEYAGEKKKQRQGKRPRQKDKRVINEYTYK